MSRRTGGSIPSATYVRWFRDGAKRWRHATRAGYGMGMGKNSLIHKGGKP